MLLGLFGLFLLLDGDTVIFCFADLGGGTGGASDGDVLPPTAPMIGSSIDSVCEWLLHCGIG